MARRALNEAASRVLARESRDQIFPGKSLFVLVGVMRVAGVMREAARRGPVLLLPAHPRAQRH